MKLQKGLKTFKRNGVADRDLYKFFHWMQIKKGLTWLTSYMEARVGAMYSHVYAVGLSYRIKTAYLEPPTIEEVNTARNLVKTATGIDGLNLDVWTKVAELGYYPMKIMGIPEGTKVPVSTPLFRIEPTEPWFADTINGEETKLMRTWYSSGLITRLMDLRTRAYPIFEKYNSLDYLDTFINGFEARSASSDETSDKAGMFSLFVTDGSDNIHGQHCLNHFYPGGETKLKSVWATEHNCALSYGPGEGEYQYVIAQLSQETDFIKSIVVDTYGTENFVDNVMTRKDIRELVLAHKGLIVLRNDSGNRNEMCRYIANSIGKSYGFTTRMGKKLLNKFAVMQADGVNPDTTISLLEFMVDDGWLPETLVVGGGTGLMFDNLTRDTNRNAIKQSAMRINNGPIIATNKAPKTDMTKASKGGELKVDKDFVTHSSLDYTKEEFDKIEDIMVPFYINGDIYSDDFPTIFERIHKSDK